MTTLLVMRSPWLPQIVGLAVALLAPLSDAAESRVYQLVPSESTVRLNVGKSGLFQGFGHEHEIAAPAFSGSVTVAGDDLSKSQVSVTFESRALEVLPEHESAQDVAKVQETMRGPQVLDSARYPRIRFASRRSTTKQVGPGVFDIQVSGELELHGVVKPVTVPLHVEIKNGQLVAKGATVIRQTDFGITPVSAAGGSVNVKNEVTVQLRLVGRTRSE